MKQMERKTTVTAKRVKMALAALALLVVFSLAILGVGPLLRMAKQGAREGTTALTGMAAYKMSSQVMEPTIQLDESVLADEKYYRHNPLRRGDVIVMDLPDHPGVSSIRRVIGLANDAISIKSGAVYVNGKRLIEPYVLSGNRKDDFSLEFGPLKVPKEQIFVLGDNRDISKDGRYWGAISQGVVQGKVLLISSSTNPARNLTKIK